MKHKIAYLVSTLRRSGPTHQLSYLLAKLDKSVFDACIITLSPEPEDSMRPLFDAMQVPVFSLQMGRIQGMLKAATAVKKLIRAENIALLHTQGLRADTIGRKIQSIPVITTLRNDPFLDYPAKYGKLKGGWMAWQQIKVAHARQGVYTCAGSLSEAFKEKYRLSLPFVRNGVDVEYFHPASPERKAKLRREMNIPEDVLLMLSVGGLLPRKDHLTSIRGWKECGRKIRFIILGEGPVRDKLNKEADVHSDLLMPGQVGNVRDYLQAADFFVSASLGEGLPNTVLEAMACGLPVILSDIPPHRECLEGLDEHRLFPPGDAEALAQEIHYLIENQDVDLQKKMRLQGEAFSAEKMSETYQEIYRKRLNVK